MPGTDPGYRLLRNAPGDLHVEVQKVQHPSRVHLDIESDDIEAEARRLEQLGAKRVSAVKSWIVMEAPTGQRFCIVRHNRRDLLPKPINGRSLAMRWREGRRSDNVEDMRGRRWWLRWRWRLQLASEVWSWPPLRISSASIRS